MELDNIFDKTPKEAPQPIGYSREVGVIGEDEIPLPDNLRDILYEICSTFSGSQSLVVEYFGSGDSFDSYSSYYLQNSEGRFEENLEWSQLSDLDAEDLLDHILSAGSISFDNEGSEGKIVIDLQERSITLSNNIVVRETISEGDIIFR